MPLKVTAKDLQTPFTILKEMDREDDWATQERRYRTVAIVWGMVTAKSGVESMIGDGIDAIQRYRVVIRYMEGITSDMVLRNDRTGHTYHIESVSEHLHQGRWLIINAAHNSANDV